MPINLDNISSKQFDVRNPWDFSNKFDLIISRFWPQEEEAQQEFLKRCRQILYPNGKVQIVRQFFEQEFSFEQLPQKAPLNNWLLCSTMLALTPKPKELKLTITNLKDSYPWKKRFFSAIMDSYNKKHPEQFSYQVTETVDAIKLVADNHTHIEMLLQILEHKLTLTVNPADQEIYKALSRFCIATFVNDISSSEEKRNTDCWEMIISACA